MHVGTNQTMIAGKWTVVDEEADPVAVEEDFEEMFFCLGFIKVKGQWIEGRTNRGYPLRGSAKSGPVLV